MNTWKVHQLLMLALACSVAVTVFFLLLEPMLGVLIGLTLVLAFVLWKRAKRDMYQAEKDIWCEKFRKLRLWMGGESNEEQSAPVCYELVMIRPNTGKVFPLNEKETTIGRSPECTCPLAAGFASVGRVHCRIVHREHSKEYYIEDLRSLNGTYLGTRRLEPNTQMKLMDNTEIIIGDVTMRFQHAKGSAQE